MRNVGTYNDPSMEALNIAKPIVGVKVTDSAIASGGAYLVSELEKRNEKIKEPLTTVTWHRDVPVKTGGGWVDYISSLNIDYGVTGGSGKGAVQAGASNTIPVVQANFGKDTFKAHTFQSAIRIGFVDMQKQNVTGRSLDKILSDGVRLAYDKHMDQNTYLGFSEFGTEGLLNKTGVAVTNVATGAGGYTAWTTKTADEILADINKAISDTWEAAGNDLRAIPNHIIMPFAQYNYIATTKVSALAEITILEYIKKNNICNQNGGNLVIGATAYCKGAGALATDRMAVYVHNDNFIAEEELVSLYRAMTQPNTSAFAYDSIYIANVSEVEIFYTQTISYWDGI